MNRLSLIRRTLVGVASLVVIAAVSYPIYKYPPSMQRKMRFDRMRIERLNSAFVGIETYYDKHKKLPADLGAVCKNCRTDYRDPETDALPDYQITGEKTFKLCSVFSLPSQKENVPQYHTSWSHEAGRFCFDLSVRTSP